MKQNLLIILFLLAGTLYSQHRFLIRNQSQIVSGKQLESIDEQYFNSNFSSALIQSDETNTVYKLRYNAYYDEIEYENNGERYNLVKTIGEKVTFRELNKIYVCLNYNYGGENYTGFLAKMFEGNNYSVYKREKIEFFEGNKSDQVKSSGSQQYKALKDVFFIKINDTIQELPGSKKKFAALFGNGKQKILNLIKENNISLRDDMDVIKLFRILDKK